MEGSYVLEVESVSHNYGNLKVLSDVSIYAQQGEFLTLLGPSGSGKTTLLRIIAGLENPSTIGALRIGGKDVRSLLAEKRDVVTVFQNYALFPHMTVMENVEYGLRVRRVAESERKKRAFEVLELVRLPDKYRNKIHQLSGGERQRVALARALVLKPVILLLDEPLGALDEKLRILMEIELLQIQRTVGTTFIYVTHSQEEALTMSDRIVLLNEGCIAQEGSPQSLYDKPKSRFVADFMGFNNIFDGIIEKYEKKTVFVQVGESIIKGTWCGPDEPKPGEPVFAAFRAQVVNLGTPNNDEKINSNRFECKLINSVYKGKYIDIFLETPIGIVTASNWKVQREIHSPKNVWWRDTECVVGPTG